MGNPRLPKVPKNPPVSKTVRMSEELWNTFQGEARLRGISVTAAFTEAVELWLKKGVTSG